MSDQDELSLWNIKSEPNTDDFSYITEKIKVEKSFNEDEFQVDLRYDTGDVKHEEDMQDFTSIKTEEVYIKNEIPVTHNTFHDSNQYVEQNKELVNLQQSHSSKNLLSDLGISKEKSFTCNLCDYKTARKYTLKIHMRTHTSEKPFACNLCDFKTSQTHHLKVHMRTHTGDKPFACNICEFKTTRKTSLTAHHRVHTGEKPFTCKLCEFKSIRQTNLNAHMRIHTGEQPFACKLCEFKTDRKSNLKRHLKMHRQHI